MTVRWLLPPGCIFNIFPKISSCMYLLYLDDSGSTANKDEEHLVLGGICIHEHQINYFTKELDNIAARLDSANPDSVEFHASAVFSGREHPWDKVQRQDRIEIIKEVLQVFAKSSGQSHLKGCEIFLPTCPVI